MDPLAFSMSSFKFLPAQWDDEGFPHFSVIYGFITSKISGNIGVVAL